MFCQYNNMHFKSVISISIRVNPVCTLGTRYVGGCHFISTCIILGALDSIADGETGCNLLYIALILINTYVFVFT
jgi:hypothetical protein